MSAAHALADATDASVSPASPWRLGDRYRRADQVVAGGFFPLAAYLFYLGDPRPALLVLVGGVALGLAMGRLAYVLPRDLQSPLTGPIPVWTSFVLWHGGVTLLALTWRGLVPQTLGVVASLCLSVAATMLLDRLVRMLRRSPHPVSLGWKLGLALLAPAGACGVVAGFMLGFSFRAGTYGGLPDLALSILVLGSLVPIGLVGIVLRPTE